MGDSACFFHVDFCVRRARRIVLLFGIALGCIAVFYFVFGVARDATTLVWFDRIGIAAGVTLFGGLSAGFLTIYFRHRGDSGQSPDGAGCERGAVELAAVRAIRGRWRWAGAPPHINEIRAITGPVPELRRRVTVVLLGPPIGAWHAAAPGPICYSTDRGNPTYIALALSGLLLAVGAFALARWILGLNSIWVATLVVLVPLAIPGSFWVWKLLVSPVQLRVTRNALEVWRYRWGRISTYRNIPIRAGTLIVITRTASSRRVSIACGELVDVIALDEVDMDDPLWPELLGKFAPEWSCREPDRSRSS